MEQKFCNDANRKSVTRNLRLMGDETSQTPKDLVRVGVSRKGVHQHRELERHLGSVSPRTTCLLLVPPCGLTHNTFLLVLSSYGLSTTWSIQHRANLPCVLSSCHPRPQPIASKLLPNVSPTHLSPAFKSWSWPIMSALVSFPTVGTLVTWILLVCPRCILCLSLSHLCRHSWHGLSIVTFLYKFFPAIPSSIFIAKVTENPAKSSSPQQS